MTQYGILDFNIPVDASAEIVRYCSKHHKTYQTELSPNLLNFIEKYGFEKTTDYFEKKVELKVLVKRDIINPIIVNFPCKAGGHFLANCLSLSEDFVISKFSNIKDRCEFLCSGYDTQNGYWDDVNIFCDIDVNQSKRNLCVSHPDEGSNVKTLWSFWTNSENVILFKNIFLFVGLRKCVIPSVGYNSDGTLRYHVPLTEEEFMKLQSEVHARNNNKRTLADLLQKNDIDLIAFKEFSLENKNKLIELFNDKKSNLRQNYSYCQLKTRKQIYFWDVNWYLEEEEFLNNIESFYIGLELDGYDRETLRKCYIAWMNAMHRCLKYFEPSI